MVANKFKYASERTITVKGLKAAKTFNEKVRLIEEEVERGTFTAQEAVSLLNAIATAATINEKTEVAKDVEILKDELKARHSQA